MKKLIALSAAILLVLGISALSYADDPDPIATEKTISATMVVTGASFGLQIWPTEYVQNLGTIAAGSGGGVGELHIYASSNSVNPWFVNAESEGLVGQNQADPDTIPVKMSTFESGDSPLTGDVVDSLVLTSSAQAIYSSGTGEAPISGLPISGIFVADTTLATKDDTYEGTVTLTMTE